MNTKNIPAWVKWLAQDKDGAIWGFEAEPHLHDHGWYENEVGRIVLLLKDSSQPVNWKNSLVSIKQIHKCNLADVLRPYFTI